MSVDEGVKPLPTRPYRPPAYSTRLSARKGRKDCAKLGCGAGEPALARADGDGFVLGDVVSVWEEGARRIIGVEEGTARGAMFQGENDDLHLLALSPCMAGRKAGAGMIRVEHGDCVAVVPRLAAEGVVVDAIVTDAPYDLQQIGRSIQHRRNGDGSDRTHQPNFVGRGFMGKEWDGTGVAFRSETWAAVGTVLKPGGFLLAFGGTRTSHRMVCAIEDAGFVVQDTIAWLYGSGFPKGRALLKPAHEPICVAYKPGGKRVLGVDECRIGTTVETWPSSRARPAVGNALYTHKLAGDDRTQTMATGDVPPGRWPANVCHDGSDEVLAAFATAGESRSSDRVRHNGEFRSVAKGSELPHDTYGHADSGSAARFYFSSKAGEWDRWTSRKHELTISWISESGPCQAVLLVATALSPARVIAASGSMDAQEWSMFLFGSGLTDLFRKASASTIRTKISSTIDLKIWSYLIHSLTSDCTPAAILSMGNGSSHAEDVESTSLSISFTLAETASLPNASHALSGERFEISGREKYVAHPTVKPISLIGWIIKLVCPPGGIFLDPFAGSGTSGVAALATGRNAILVEQHAGYVADIRERLAFYEGEGRHSLAAKARHAVDRPGPLL